MATTGNGVWTPDASSNYNLTTDLAAMAASIDTALVKSANAYKGTAAQREAFTSAPDGTLWSDTNGTRRLWMRQSGAWVEANSLTDTGWVDLDVPSTVAQRPGAAYTPQVRRLGNLVHFRGEWNNKPWPAGGGWVTMGTVPTWAAPPKAFRFVAPINFSGAAQISVLLGHVSTDRSINIFATGSLPPASHFAPSIPPWMVD